MKVPYPTPPYRTALKPAATPSSPASEEGQQYFFSDKFKLGQLGVSGSNV